MPRTRCLSGMTDDVVNPAYISQSDAFTDFRQFQSCEFAQIYTSELPVNVFTKPHYIGNSSTVPYCTEINSGQAPNYCCTNHIRWPYDFAFQIKKSNDVSGVSHPSFDHNCAGPNLENYPVQLIQPKPNGRVFSRSSLTICERCPRCYPASVFTQSLSESEKFSASCAQSGQCLPNFCPNQHYTLSARCDLSSSLSNVVYLPNDAAPSGQSCVPGYGFSSSCPPQDLKHHISSWIFYLSHLQTVPSPSIQIAPIVPCSRSELHGNPNITRLQTYRRKHTSESTIFESSNFNRFSNRRRSNSSNFPFFHQAYSHNDRFYHVNTRPMGFQHNLGICPALQSILSNSQSIHYSSFGQPSLARSESFESNHLGSDRPISNNISQATELDEFGCKPNWLSLPYETWLLVVRLLPLQDRANLAGVCRHLTQIVRDTSLWRRIHIRRRNRLTDAALAMIGRCKPRELSLMYCRGDNITVDGLRDMFRACGSGLRKFTFIGCTKGPFDRDHALLFAARYCFNLHELNISYTQAVRDRTIVVLAKSARNLVSVKLNGAQFISSFAIQQLVRYHKHTLRHLELFGCFRLKSQIFTDLQLCSDLRALAFGHLHHLSSNGLLELVDKLPHLTSLDLRGTRDLVMDSNLPTLAEKCPLLEVIVLANMHSLKREAGIAKMCSRLPCLRIIDLCGLEAVGDLTMEALANGCPQLEDLDVSCTSVTRKGIEHLASAPTKNLCSLRVSHCRELTKTDLEKLVRTCEKLSLLYLYGFQTIDDWGSLLNIRPTIRIQTEH